MLKNTLGWTGRPGEDRILIFSPEIAKYRKLLCVKLLFRCKLSKTDSQSPFWLFSRGGRPLLQGVEPSTPRQFLPWGGGEWWEWGSSGEWRELGYQRRKAGEGVTVGSGRRTVNNGEWWWERVYLRWVAGEELPVEVTGGGYQCGVAGEGLPAGSDGKEVTSREGWERG